MDFPTTSVVESRRQKCRTAFAGRSTLTPVDLAKDMVGKTFEELPNDPEKLEHMKFVDPACGTGIFGAVVADYLYKRLEPVISDPEKRIRHIAREQIWMYDASLAQVEVARELFPDFFEPKIIQKDTINEELSMKFDVVVGNPPYEEPGKIGGSAKLWAEFVEKSKSLLKTDGLLSLVHPNGWFTNSSSKTGKIYETLNDGTILYLNINSVEDYFPNVSTGDCGWYVYKNFESDLETKVMTEDGMVNVNLNKFDRIPKTLNPTVVSILEKTIFSEDNEKFNFVKDSGNYRDRSVPTTRNDKDYVVDEKDREHTYPIVNTVYVDGSVRKMWSSTENYWQENPKVLVSQSSTYNPYFDENSGFTQNITALVFDEDETQKAKNAENVLSKNLYEFLVDVQKVGKAISPESLKNLPKVDLEKKWSDEELYDHFDLSDDEIKEIEQFVS